MPDTDKIATEIISAWDDTFIESVSAADFLEMVNAIMERYGIEPPTD